MKHKIYFAGSIRGGRENKEVYNELVTYLKQFGDVLSEHIGDKTLLSMGESLDNSVIHNRDLDWVLSANMIIAEVTTPSLGVGYELGRAVENRKKILCLYRPQEDKKLSAMIAGCPEITCRPYNNVDEAKEIIKTFIDKNNFR